ncbi:MAG: MBL fold metallo-hydrolase [Clostridia bacterium]|nr:MBL fold metallo-hydrolase [Clostridia bacterium]
MNDRIELIAQSAIRIETKNGKIIYFDPYKLNGKYSEDADLIFITHPHFDHFSPEDIEKIKTNQTKIIAPKELSTKIEQLGFKTDNIILVMPNEKNELEEIIFETIPAYNTNKDYHRKEYNWVGYIVTIDGKRIYVAGDTDNIEEARKIKCDIACVPVGGTYTMNYKEAAELIKAIKPKTAIPIHYKTIVGSSQDAIRFKEELQDIANVEIIMN